MARQTESKVMNLFISTWASKFKFKLLYWASRTEVLFSLEKHKRSITLITGGGVHFASCNSLAQISADLSLKFSINKIEVWN